MSFDNFSTDARLLIEFGKETRAKNASLQGDMPTFESCKTAIAQVAELTERVVALGLRINEIEEETKGLEESAIARRELHAERNDAMSDLLLAGFDLDDAKKRVADLLDKIAPSGDRSAVEEYLENETPESMAAAQLEVAAILARANATLGISE